MEELTLKQIQDESFKVLLKIKQICEENDIKYFLAYGTLIGAIRHEGFIPWDDDIDIWMPRQDFEKFIQYCIDNEENLKPLELKHYRTCKDYIYPIARLSDSRYKINYDNAKDYGLGLFVDIYPMDGFNSGDKRLIRKMSWLNRKIILAGSKKMIKSKSLIKNILKFPYYVYTRFVNINKTLKKHDKLAQKYDFDCEKYCWIGWDFKMPDGRLVYYETQDFDKSVNKSFEGNELAVPLNYDKLLTQTYGDYMQLPPEEDRIGHHFYTVTKK